MNEERSPRNLAGALTNMSVLSRSTFRRNPPGFPPVAPNVIDPPALLVQPSRSVSNVLKISAADATREIANIGISATSKRMNLIWANFNPDDVIERRIACLQTLNDRE